MGTVPSISLIVATLGRSRELLRFLESANRQADQGFEVIIVDQNEDDRVKKLLDSFAASFPMAYYHQTEKNASKARNAGALVARGQWLGFPDDDCVYSADTIAQVRSLTKTTASSLISGAILDFENNYFAKSLRTSSEVTWHNIRGKITEPAMFIRTEVFHSIGGFDPQFGPGSKNFAGEALDLGLRVLKAGSKISLHNDIRVFHDKSIPPYDERAIGVGYRYSYANGLALVKAYRYYAWYYLAKQTILLPLRSLIRNYPADKKAYYKACRQGLFDGIVHKISRR